MLYTIIDIYEVLRTDELYPQDCEKSDKGSVCTDPYKFLSIHN